jgi:hypothetical protein
MAENFWLITVLLEDVAVGTASECSSSRSRPLRGRHGMAWRPISTNRPPLVDPALCAARRPIIQGFQNMFSYLCKNLKLETYARVGSRREVLCSWKSWKFWRTLAKNSKLGTRTAACTSVSEILCFRNRKHYFVTRWDTWAAN